MEFFAKQTATLLAPKVPSAAKQAVNTAKMARPLRVLIRSQAVCTGAQTRPPGAVVGAATTELVTETDV